MDASVDRVKDLPQVTDLKPNDSLDATPPDSMPPDLLPQTNCGQCEFGNHPAGPPVSCQSGAVILEDSVTTNGFGGDSALFKVNLNHSSCQIKELWVALDICNPAGNYVFHLGNSPSNDGQGGDAGERVYDSELQVNNLHPYNPTVDAGVPSRFDFNLFVNDNGLQDLGQSLFETLPDIAPVNSCTQLTFVVSDGKLRIFKEAQLLKQIDSSYIFRLNQPDPSNSNLPDAELYVGINRVVNSGSAFYLSPPRAGIGIKHALIIAQ